VQTAPDRTAGVKLEVGRACRLVGLRGIWVDLIRRRGPDCFVSSVFAAPEIFTQLSFLTGTRSLTLRTHSLQLARAAESSRGPLRGRARVRFRVLADDYSTVL
jgi:hypothetical protein